MLDPSFRVRAVEVLRSLFSTWYQLENQLGQWHMEFAQIALLGDPVVHLHIDVGVVVSVPWCLESVRPEPLEVRRQAAFACAADQQIAPEIIVQ